MNNRTSHKRRSPSLQEYMNSDLFEDEPALKHMKTWFKDRPQSANSSDEQNYAAVESGEEFPSFLSSMTHASAAATASIAAAAAAVFTPTPHQTDLSVVANQDSGAGKNEEAAAITLTLTSPLADPSVVADSISEEEKSEEETPINTHTSRPGMPSRRDRILFTYKLLYVLQDIEISSLDQPALQTLLTSLDRLLLSIKTPLTTSTSASNDNNSLNRAIERLISNKKRGKLDEFSKDISNVNQLLDLLSSALTEKKSRENTLNIFKKLKFHASYNVRLHPSNKENLNIDIKESLRKIKNLVTQQISLLNNSTATANSLFAEEAAGAAASTVNNTAPKQNEDDNNSDIEIPKPKNRKPHVNLVKKITRLKFKLAYILKDIKIASLDLPSLKALSTSVNHLLTVSDTDNTFSEYLSTGNNSLSLALNIFNKGGTLGKLYTFSENISNVTQLIDLLSSALTDVKTRADTLILFRKHDSRPLYCTELNKNSNTNESCDLKSVLEEFKKLVSDEINLREVHHHPNADEVVQTASTTSQSRDSDIAVAALLSLSLFRPMNASAQQITESPTDELSLRK